MGAAFVGMETVGRFVNDVGIAKMLFKHTPRGLRTPDLSPQVGAGVMGARRRLIRLKIPEKLR